MAQKRLEPSFGIVSLWLDRTEKVKRGSPGHRNVSSLLSCEHISLRLQQVGGNARVEGHERDRPMPSMIVGVSRCDRCDSKLTQGTVGHPCRMRLSLCPLMREVRLFELLSRCSTAIRSQTLPPMRRLPVRRIWRPARQVQLSELLISFA